jgi:hypothetical protein
LLDANNNVIASKAIVWEVDRPGVTDDATVSESDVPLLREAIEAAGRAATYADRAQATYDNFAEVVADQVEQMQIHEGQTVIDGTLTVSGAAADAKVTGDEITGLKNDLMDIDTILEYQKTVNIPVEQYSINANTGANTSSSYTTYYRTAGFYKATHIKATSTKGTLKSRLYFYSTANVSSYISCGDFVNDMDADVIYPDGANYIRVAGFVDGNPDNPLDLSAVTLETESQNAITRIKEKQLEIENTLTDVGIENTIASHIDTDVPYNLIPSDMTWIPDKQILPADGGVGIYAGRYASDFIPIDADKEYIYLNVAVIDKSYNSDGTYTSRTVAPFVRYNYAFYTADKKFVASESDTSSVVKKIPQDAAYIRVTVTNEESTKYARLIYAPNASATAPTIGQVEYKKIPKSNYQMPLTGYENGFKMIAFGDSITHGDLTGNNDGLSYVNYASQYLNADIESVGFGSTTAARVAETPSGTGLFAFWHLCDCIVSEDPNVWADLDAWAASPSGNTSYAEHLARLKAVDWNNVNAISILYGANDWAVNIPVGTDYNVDPYKYDGAIAYGITKLLTKYPHLQVLVLSPFYRKRTIDGQEYISDDANTAGVNMAGYAASLRNIQTKLHVPVAGSDNWGINYLTMKVLSIDGTHPITNIGKWRLGHLYANAIQTYLSPI